MTSLFSPFDVFFFHKGMMFLNMVCIIFSFSLFLFSSSKILLSFPFSYLSNFFCSLKNKGMNKMSSLLFICVFSIFFFYNFFSVFSYNFPISAQVSVVMGASVLFWLSFILFNLFFSMKKLLFHLSPEGSPLILVPFLFLIEVVSNMIRPITLMIRLVANVLAGHLLMILLGKLILISPPMFLFYIILNVVELAVALIQAYIFCTMLTLYFSES